jgi:hypothetical protein
MRQKRFTTKNTKGTKETAKMQRHDPRTDLIFDELGGVLREVCWFAFFVVFVSFVVNSFCQIEVNNC